MVIELRGVEFVNKGAELMLHAIMHKVKERFPNALFVMEPTHRVRLEKLAEYNIYEKKGSKVLIIPKFVRRKLRFVHDSEVDIVLDGSGFAFGDQWGPKHAEKKLGQRIATWRKQGKKVILLPQAFGPFSDPDLRTIMERIVPNADLIFAREDSSFQHLKSISDSPHILQAPDFTNLLLGKVPENFDASKMQVAIIPNRKMIDKKGDAGKHYINFLCLAVGKVRSQGLKPYFLIHEGKQDIEIAKEVNALLHNPLQIIINPDPLAIKGIIATAYFIICSRFHGIVSALSQGVPCISTSWSHKYEMLHVEYNYEEGLVKDIESIEEIEQKITDIADPERNKAISEKLFSNSLLQRQRSTAMWDKVFASME